jgi:hypothetical protein
VKIKLSQEDQGYPHAEVKKSHQPVALFLQSEIQRAKNLAKE